MLVVTTPEIAGYEIVESIGIARGATVRAKHIGTDIVAALTMLVGGELKGYSSLLAGAREQAMDRMIADARAQGADAIVSMRMQTSTIARNSSEIVCYGTAVRLTRR